MGIQLHWGEGYSNIHPLIQLYIIEISTGKVSILDNIPTNGGGYALGQPIFAPNDKHVLYTAWDAGNTGNDNDASLSSGEQQQQNRMKRRLGAIYCTQRPCRIYMSSISHLFRKGDENRDEDEDEDVPLSSQQLSSSCICLTPRDALARSPTILTKTKTTTVNKTVDHHHYLAYLGNRKGFDTHNGCMGLFLLPLNERIGIMHDDEKNESNNNNSDNNNSNNGGKEEENDDVQVLVPVIYSPVNNSNNNNNSNPTATTTATTATPATIANLPFPGIFATTLSCNNSGRICSSIDGKYIYTNTQWGSVSTVIRIATSDGTIIPLCGNTTTSNDLLCVTSNGDIITSSTAPNQPPIIRISSNKKREGDNKYTFQKLFSTPSPIICASQYPESSSFLSSTSSTTPISSTFQILHTPPIPPPTSPPHCADSINTTTMTILSDDISLQSILMLPGSDDDHTNNSNDGSTGNDDNSKLSPKLPLLVFVHGGPHSCSSSRYIPSLSYLCQYGKYAILSINYRGSVGFGQNFVEALPGHIGTLDVSDVTHVTKHTLNKYKHLLDDKRVGICGGSHGGYLTCHLIGRYPNLFKVAAMRNPVTNVATMVTATDISDWCYVEALGISSSSSAKYDPSTFQPPTNEQLQRMYEVSPIRYVSNVTAPTLIGIGLSDLRVPPSQGLEFYHSLPDNTLKKLLLYEKDNHAIDIIRSEANHWLNVKLWFDKYL